MTDSFTVHLSALLANLFELTFQASREKSHLNIGCFKKTAIFLHLLLLSATFNSHITTQVGSAQLCEGKQGGSTSCIITSVVCIPLAFLIYRLVSLHYWNVCSRSRTAALLQVPSNQHNAACEEDFTANISDQFCLDLRFMELFFKCKNIARTG